MQFRPGRMADIAPCIALLRADGGFRASPAVWSRLESLWRDWVESDAVIFSVWEDATRRDGQPPTLHGFGMNAFVPAQLTETWCAQPRPYFVAGFYEHVLDGRQGLLHGADVGRANAGDGLDLAVLHCVFRPRTLGDPLMQRLVPVMAEAWAFCHAGYRIRRVVHEVYGADHVMLASSAGLRVLADFRADG